MTDRSAKWKAKFGPLTSKGATMRSAIEKESLQPELRLGRDLLTCIQQKNAATVKACLEQQVPKD